MSYVFIDVIQYVLDGALRGMLLALIALAFIVIYRAGRILNFAQGEVVAVGGFFVWTFVSVPLLHGPLHALAQALPSWLFVVIALILAAIAVSVFGILIERVIFRPLIGQPVFSIVMATIGLMILLQGIMLVVWGAEDRPFPLIFPRGAVRLGPFIFTRSIFWGGIISIGVFALISWLFERTRWGLKLTAVAEDHQVAQSMGISVKKSIAIAWVIGSLLSAWAAIVFLNGQTLTFAAASIGLQALPVALLAGLESIWGAPLGGVIVGVGASLSAAYLDEYTGGAASEAFPYLLMLLILLVRPQGLFGWKIIERV
jgi:branched-chain amino acid transport system permease protein